MSFSRERLTNHPSSYLEEYRKVNHSVSISKTLAAETARVSSSISIEEINEREELLEKDLASNSLKNDSLTFSNSLSKGRINSSGNIAKSKKNVNKKVNFTKIKSSKNIANKQVNYSDKFDSIVKFINADNLKRNNKLEIHKILSSDSVFYAPESEAPRSEIYREILKGFYPDDYFIENKESHHTKLDRSSDDPRFLVFLSKEAHKSFHEILEYENKIEILEYFKKTNFEEEYIEVNGVGTTFKHGIYHLKNLTENVRNSNIVLSGETLLEKKHSFVNKIIESLIFDISNILEAKSSILDELSESLKYNQAYQDYIAENNNDKNMVNPVSDSFILPLEPADNDSIEESTISKEDIVVRSYDESEIKIISSEPEKEKKPSFFSKFFGNCFTRKNHTSMLDKKRMNDGIYERLF